MAPTIVPRLTATRSQRLGKGAATKQHRLVVRMNPDELAELHKVARQQGQCASDLVRGLLASAGVRLDVD
jgi:hypothetical protein